VFSVVRGFSDIKEQYLLQNPYTMILSIRRRMMTMGTKYFHAIIGIVFTVLFLTYAQAFGGEETVINGIPTVRNSSIPSHGHETIRLVEQWRAGGEDDDTVFGLITQVRTDPDGYIYLLDAQLCEVYIYSPDGEFVRSVFREGDGPGEIREPVDMLIFEDGSVGAAHEFPAVITMVDRRGNPAGSLQLGGDDPAARSSMSLIGCNANGGNIVISGSQFNMSDTPGIQDRTNFLASFSSNGSELVRYMENKTQYDFTDFSFIEREHTPHFWWGYAVGWDGRVYVPRSRDEYAIHMYSKDGTLERVFERECETWFRTNEEKKRMRTLIEGATAGSPGEVHIVVEDTEPAIAYFHRGLRVTSNGNLWVLPSRGLRDQPEDVFITYDVFDPNGNFIKQVSVACDGNPMSDGLFIINEDRAVMVRGYLDALAAQFGRGVTFTEDGEEPALMEVICYTIEGNIP